MQHTFYQFCGNKSTLNSIFYILKPKNETFDTPFRIWFWLIRSSLSHHETRAVSPLPLIPYPFKSSSHLRFLFPLCQATYISSQEVLFFADCRGGRAFKNRMPFSFISYRELYFSSHQEIPVPLLANFLFWHLTWAQHRCVKHHH